MRSTILVGWLALLAAAPAWAQNATTPTTIELYPTFHAIGARIAYAGDDNGNATARIDWRPAGAGGWTQGVPMTRITNRRFAASVLWLEPGTAYDVRAVVTDPDGGGTVSSTTSTRSNPVATPSGQTWWVAPNGSDAGAGSSGAPLATLQEAANRAQPGDEIRVRPGVYHQSVEPPRSGTAAQPIHLVADGPGVILDGSDPAYLQRNDWTSEGGGVYSVPFAGETRLVCADSLQRLYTQASVSALASGGAGVNQGFVVSGGRLYVRLEDGSNPAGHVMHVARYEVGIYLDQSHWHVKGLEVRYFGLTNAGSGIYLRGANSCVIENNHVHTIGGNCIYLRVLAADNLIQNNLVRDPRIYTWPWDATKAHDEEKRGISNRGGRGNVIRYNTVDGTFDGIDIAGGETDENVGADCDFYENTVTRIRDDALEPESIAGINVRLWKNRVDDVFSTLSIAPNSQGPTYILYNTFTNYSKRGLKFSISSVGETWFCHNTIVSAYANTSAIHPTGPFSNMHFRNNILVGNGQGAASDDAGESQSGITFDGDLLHSTGTSTLFRWKGVNYSSLSALRSGTGFEANGRSGDPLFVSPGSGDYSLRPGSPAIDAGVRLPGINDAFHGGAPDIGAHESGLSGPDSTPPAAIQDLHAEG